MAYINGGKPFGQYTYEHWFDHEYGNKINITISELTENEVSIVSEMVEKLFNEFIGIDYSEEGNNTFRDHIKPQNILKRTTEEGRQLFTAKLEGEIIGIIEIKNKSHISLLFVKKEYHRQGIGKLL
jgi:GNAT superfamily N-acetyltransferase